MRTKYYLTSKNDLVNISNVDIEFSKIIAHKNDHRTTEEMFDDINNDKPPCRESYNLVFDSHNNYYRWLNCYNNNLHVDCYKTIGIAINTLVNDDFTIYYDGIEVHRCEDVLYNSSSD